ncbi:hypothetical protein [Photobacterium leiognathi]|uniref:hypothetical protein n=1 Tax=Photobacterium leiognathi TaxID=553611 RepID=UPI00298221F5|nr:hypothetical protein [Photobacterium leiognathi]
MYNAAPTIHSKSACGFLSKVIEGHQFEVCGPFESADATMKFAHEHHVITSYRGAPEFDDGMGELLEALKAQ